MVALGLTQMIAWGSTYYLPTVLAEPISIELGISSSWFFAAFSGAILLSAAVAPSVGRSIDRLGGRPTLATSSAVLALGLSFLAISQGPASLVLAWSVIGLGMGLGLYDAAFAALASLYGSAARGPITGVTLIAGFASTIAWPLTLTLQEHVGWRGACGIWAAINLLVALPLHWTSLHGPQVHSDPAAVSAQYNAKPSAILLILLAYVFAAGWFVSTIVAAHLPTILKFGGASLTVAVAAGALIGPAQVAARLGELGLLKRFHPLTAAATATLLFPVGAAAFYLFEAPAWIFTVLHGAGNGLLTIAVGTLPLKLFGARGYGARQGTLVIPARIAQALAPWSFARALSAYQQQALLLPVVALLLAFIALLVIRHLSRRNSDRNDTAKSDSVPH